MDNAQFFHPAGKGRLFLLRWPLIRRHSYGWFGEFRLHGKTPSSKLLSPNSSQVHGEQETGLGQIMNADHRARWSMVAHHFNVWLVHTLKILHVLEKDVQWC
jgi:hypothetical protein